MPEDCDSSFNPMTVNKIDRTTVDIQNIIISLYAKGMSNSDIEEQMREIYDLNTSKSTIFRITDRITNDITAKTYRPLEATYLFV